MNSIYAILIVFDIAAGGHSPAVVEQLKPMVVHRFQCENVKNALVTRYTRQGYKIKYAKCYLIGKGIDVSRDKD